jgi:hypothetical protein
MEDFSGHKITKARVNIGSKDSMEQKLKKYFIVLFLLLACFITVVVIKKLYSSMSEPELVAAETVYDFGSVSYGKILEYSFSIKNDGTIPITVESVKTSCPCLTAEIDNKSIDPQYTATLKGTYIPTEDNFDYAKDISEQIVVKTGQPNQKEMVFTVSAMTIPQF